MNSDTQPASPGVAGNIIGWCILGAALGPLTVAFITARALGGGSPVGANLLLSILPTLLMMVLAGVGLIMRKPFGYWSAYLATFFGGIGGLKTPFVPFVQRYVNFGPSTGQFFLVLNLILIAILAWEHWTKIEAEGGERRNVRRWTLAGMLLAGTISVSIGLVSEKIYKQEVSSAGTLPAIGPYFAQLDTAKNTAVRSVIVHNKLFHSVDGVISGTTSEEALRKFAEYHGLRAMERSEVYRRILPKTRKWKLNEKGFETEFSPPDLVFMGRPKSGDKAVLQIAWKKDNSKFTAEIIGSITE